MDNVTEYLEKLVANARVAQKEYEKLSQEECDKAAKAVGKAVYDNADLLAKMAVEETRMGKVESKIAKCKNKSKSTWWRMRDKKSRGVIEVDKEMGIIKYAKPIGVIGCVTPTTNPVINPMQNSMCALKCGNAIIICPHPRSKGVVIKTVELMNEALDKLGMPKNLIQIIEEPTVQISAALMGAVDTCICTGGPSMVKAAYSSGKPAIGVGQGNTQALVDRDVDIDEAVGMIITGRTFDNGVLCTCEQNIIAPREKEQEVIDAIKAHGGYYIGDEATAERLREEAFPEGRIAPEFPGASVEKIAEIVGLPEEAAKAKVIACCTKGIGREDVLAKEKLFPVLSVFLYDKWEDAINIAKTNLEMEGMGHSIVIHSNTEDHIMAAANTINVSRYAVNQVGGTALGGAMDNGLNPTTTLGCGTWGNNSISENFTYYHMMNVSRISYRVKDMYIPTDEEIWAS